MATSSGELSQAREPLGALSVQTFCWDQTSSSCSFKPFPSCDQESTRRPLVAQRCSKFASFRCPAGEPSNMWYTSAVSPLCGETNRYSSSPNKSLPGSISPRCQCVCPL